MGIETKQFISFNVVCAGFHSAINSKMAAKYAKITFRNQNKGFTVLQILPWEIVKYLLDSF